MKSLPFRLGTNVAPEGFTQEREHILAMHH